MPSPSPYVLALFGPLLQAARSAYRLYVIDGIAMGWRKDLAGGGLVRSHSGWSAVRELHWNRVYRKGDESVFLAMVLLSMRFSVNPRRNSVGRFRKRGCQSRPGSGIYCQGSGNVYLVGGVSEKYEQVRQPGWALYANRCRPYLSEPAPCRRTPWPGSLSGCRLL